MSAPHLLVLVAVASVTLGFAVTRFISAGRPRVPESQVLGSLVAEPVAPSAAATDHSSATDLSSASTSTRIADVVELGAKYRSLSDDHALFLAISKLEAPDFLGDAEEMLERFKKSDSPFGSPNLPLAEAWIERWLEVDSPSALRFLESSTILKEAPPGRSLRSQVASVQGGLIAVPARRQPEWVQQYLGTLKPGAPRDVGIFQLLNEVAQQNVAKGREMFAEFSQGSDRRAAVQGYVIGLAMADVRAGFDVAAAEAAGPLRKELLELVLRKAAERGVGIVQELVGRVDDAALRWELVADAALEISWRSGDDTLPWLMEEVERMPSLATPKGEFEYWSGPLAQALQTSGDTARALEWAAALPNDPEKKLLLNMLGGWDQRDSAGLRDWLSSHSDTLDAAAAEKLGQTLVNLARWDASGTGAWAEALPPGPLRDQALFQIALSFAKEGDPAVATANYASLAPTDANGAFAKQLASALAIKEGAAAAKWAIALPSGPARTAALSTVAEQWSQRDPRGAAEWLQQMPAGAERDAVVHEYAAKVAYADPLTAAEWVEQVADPLARGKAAEAVFWTWSFEDPVASRSWLRALPGVEESWRREFLHRAR